MLDVENPKIPRHLSAAATRWFRAILADFELDEHHLTLLQCAAEQWDVKELARKSLKTHGQTFKNRHGEIRPRPELKIQNDATILFCRALREIALDIDPPENRAPRLQG